jgi:hypothetical protein
MLADGRWDLTRRLKGYPVCGISLRDHKLLMTKDEGKT